MKKIEFRSKSLRDDIIDDSFLNAQLYALGHTLTDMGPEIGYILSTRIGNYMLEYLEDNGVKFKLKNPIDGIIELWEYYINKGLIDIPAQLPVGGIFKTAQC